jgi:hypothetical protein
VNVSDLMLFMLSSTVPTGNESVILNAIKNTSCNPGKMTLNSYPRYISHVTLRKPPLHYGEDKPLHDPAKPIE